MGDNDLVMWFVRKVLCNFEVSNTLNVSQNFIYQFDFAGFALKAICLIMVLGAYFLINF